MLEFKAKIKSQFYFGIIFTSFGFILGPFLHLDINPPRSVEGSKRDIERRRGRKKEEIESEKRLVRERRDKECMRERE